MPAPRVRLKGVPRNPSKILTNEFIDRFCDLIAEGIPPDTVCDFLCVSNFSYYRWLRHGMAYLECIAGDAEPVENHDVFAEFVRRFRMAFATYRIDLVRQLHSKGNKDWYKSMAILERRDRSTFGRDERAGDTEPDEDPDEKFL